MPEPLVLLAVQRLAVLTTAKHRLSIAALILTALVFQINITWALVFHAIQRFAVFTTAK
jgi:hypothetical protein